MTLTSRTKKIMAEWRLAFSRASARPNRWDAKLLDACGTSLRRSDHLLKPIELPNCFPNGYFAPRELAYL
jgi:hypothetical protein